MIEDIKQIIVALAEIEIVVTDTCLDDLVWIPSEVTKFFASEEFICLN